MNETMYMFSLEVIEERETEREGERISCMYSLIKEMSIDEF